MEEKVCSFIVLIISLQHQVFVVLRMTRYCPALELAICVFICGILERKKIRRQGGEACKLKLEAAIQ